MERSYKTIPRQKICDRKLIWTAADKQSYDYTNNPECRLERELHDTKANVE